MRFSATGTGDRLLPTQLAERARPWLTRVDSLISARDARGEAGRNALIAFAIRIVNAVIAFFSQVFLARWMGSFEYGIYVLVWVTMIILGNISCLGFHTAIIRFIPEYRLKGAFGELRGVNIAGRLFVLGTSTLFMLAGLLGLYVLEPVIESYYIVPFYLGLICLPMLALSDLLQGVSRANAWVIWALLPAYFIRPLLILLFMAIAVLSGYAPDAKTAIVTAIIATYVTTLVQFVSITTRVDRNMPAGKPRYAMKHWVGVSLPIFLVESFYFLLTNADVLMVGRYMAPSDVAVYFATVKTLALVHFVYFAVKASVAQRYSAYMHGGDRSGLATFAAETVNWTFWPSLAMGVIVLIIGKPMLMLFGSGFSDGYPLLFLLVSCVVARAAVGPAESLLTMSGHQKICAAIYAATLGINVGLNIILIPIYGLWGAAIATGIAILFEAASLSFTAWRKLGIRMLVFLPRSRKERNS
ncbi:lipopolysaccharide biosynthesis protein [Nitratireductor kimnyeongensis]|uniref:Lipopolysaccharide biosynthesis protein n=1 Tax=Nitratireductor kimnyeongensis TaxID=430679 RepID=A0ABW0T9T5_9HYPH|nr:lipopolysaccharide biosynthesis protein [Nitratireductor kimnyeongensis]QZZ36484.1 lipopolysaccharide biosynthesis protein [Nitratireductor kimnyeongensis]